jgi:hypothetical protein
MPDYRRMLATLYEAAGIGCQKEGVPQLGVLKWKDYCEECEEYSKCPSQLLLVQAVELEMSLETENGWPSESLKLFLAQPLTPSTT